jgi:Flp pilus assembly protein TadD
MTPRQSFWTKPTILVAVGVVAFGVFAGYRALRHVDHAAEGYTALRSGDNQKAIDELRIAVVELPNWAENHYNLGIAYENVGWNDKALPELEQAALLEPKNDTYRRGLAQTKRTLGFRAHAEKRYLDAVKLYQGALTLVGDDATTWYNLSLALQKLARNDEAAKAIQRANELDPDHPHQLPQGS